MRIPNPKPHIELEFHVLNELKKIMDGTKKLIRKSRSENPGLVIPNKLKKAMRVRLLRINS